MEMFDPCQHLFSKLPYFILVEALASFKPTFDQMWKISLRGIIHDDAQMILDVIKECLSVLDYVGMLDGGQDPYLIERILLIFFF